MFITSRTRRREVGRRKLVRVHVVNGPSLEGIYDGHRAGHYVLLQPKLLDAQGATVALDGSVEVPEQNVLFVQVLADGTARR
jgi:hypothetical protein